MIFLSIVIRWCILHSHHNHDTKSGWLLRIQDCLPLKSSSDSEGPQSWFHKWFLSPCHSVVPWSGEQRQSPAWKGHRRRRILAACCCFIHPVQFCNWCSGSLGKANNASKATLWFPLRSVKKLLEKINFKGQNYPF